MTCGLMYILLAGLGLFFCGLFAVLCCLWPHGSVSRQARMCSYQERLIAHRGLFVPQVRPENSLAAFSEACRYGYGVELDVQLSKDGKLVVFHDETLNRVCGVKGYVRDYTYQELQHFSLDGTTERIPLFADVLATVNGKVPLIVEVKPEGDCIGAAERTAVLLDAYQGEYCVESFNPRVVVWFRRHRPQVIRGQLSTDYFKDDPHLPFGKKFLLTNLFFNFLARPDFIAYNHRFARRLSLSLIRRFFCVSHVAWTVRSESELAWARNYFSVFIFDSFIPQKTDRRTG